MRGNRSNGGADVMQDDNNNDGRNDNIETPLVDEHWASKGMQAVLARLCRKTLVRVMCDTFGDGNGHYAVPLSLVALASVSAPLATFCTASPVYALRLFDQAASAVQDRILLASSAKHLLSKKPNVHVRLYFSPSMIPPPTAASSTVPTASIVALSQSATQGTQHSRTAKPELHVLGPGDDGLPSGVAPTKSFSATVYEIPRARDVGHWRVFRGTVVRTSDRQVLQFAKDYQCSECRGVWRVESTREAFNSIERPVKCCSSKAGPQCKNGRILDLDVVNPLQTTDGNASNLGRGIDSENDPHQNQSTVSQQFSSAMPGFAADPHGKMTMNSRSTASRRSIVKDYQEIKVQEAVDRVGVGTVPKSIVVILEDDLVDSLRPGEEALICGPVMQRFRFMKQNEKVEGQLVLVANHVRSLNVNRARSIEITEELRDEFVSYWHYWRNVRNDPIQGRDFILKAFASSIYGMAFVKLAIMLVLVGGVEKQQDRMRIRGDIHLLLVGDPGTGKSQFLKAATQVASRSIFTTGIGSTSAGLTCAAVRENGEWHLDAGALVLADRGVCCIDEFSAIGESEKTAIHEAMEQQTISVAKAGIVTALPTRCAVLAATNPKGNYDPVSGLSLNVGIASPLLSRFDLVMVLLDRHNEAWDKAVSDYILCKEWDDSTNGRESTSSSSGADDLRSFNELLNINDTPVAEESTDNCDGFGLGFWTTEKLRSYIAYCKEERIPSLTPEASTILQAYYQSQRQSDMRNAGRTTIRLLESLIRLAQAHAKLLIQDFVTVDDAVIVVRLMDASFQSTALVDNTVVSPLHTPFPSNQAEDHKKWLLKVTKVLNPELYRELKESGASRAEPSVSTQRTTTTTPNAAVSLTTVSERTTTTTPNAAVSLTTISERTTSITNDNNDEYNDSPRQTSNKRVRVDRSNLRDVSTSSRQSKMTEPLSRRNRENETSIRDESGVSGVSFVHSDVGNSFSIDDSDTDMLRGIGNQENDSRPVHKGRLQISHSDEILPPPSESPPELPTFSQL